MIKKIYFHADTLVDTTSGKVKISELNPTEHKILIYDAINDIYRVTNTYFIETINESMYLNEYRFLNNSNTLITSVPSSGFIKNGDGNKILTVLNTDEITNTDGNEYHNVISIAYGSSLDNENIAILVNDILVLFSYDDETNITCNEPTLASEPMIMGINEASSPAVASELSSIGIANSYKGLLTVKVDDDSVKAIYPKTYADLIIETDNKKVFTSNERTKLSGIATNANNYVLPKAGTSLGGIAVGYNTNATARNYAVKLDGNNAYVNVPWTDTTYSATLATGTTNGLMTPSDKAKLDGIATNANNYSLPTASNSTLGGIKLGYTTSLDNKNYKVQVDSNGNAFVSVPWVDTDTKYTAGTGISISSQIITNTGVRSVATGTTNGTINVNTNGTTSAVKVYGLGSAAYLNDGNVTPKSHTHDVADLKVGTDSLSNIYATKTYSDNNDLIRYVSVNGTNVAPSSKRVNISVPTKYSQLTNDVHALICTDSETVDAPVNLAHFNTYNDLITAYPFGTNKLCLVLTASGSNRAGIYYYANSVWTRTTIFD